MREEIFTCDVCKERQINKSFVLIDSYDKRELYDLCIPCFKKFKKFIKQIHKTNEVQK